MVSSLRLWGFWSRSCHWGPVIFSLELGLVIMTQTFYSPSQPRHPTIFLVSISLGLVIEIQTSSVFVSVLNIQIWSLKSLVLAQKRFRTFNDHPQPVFWGLKNASIQNLFSRQSSSFQIHPPPSPCSRGLNPVLCSLHILLLLNLARFTKLSKIWKWYNKIEVRWRQNPLNCLLLLLSKIVKDIP